MKILITQESDWLARNSHQQHHLAELLSLRGHEIRVIDVPDGHQTYPTPPCWKIQENRYGGTIVYHGVNKIYPGAKVTVIRPHFVNLPFLKYVSLFFAHRREIKRQVREFKPDVIVGLGILNAFLASRTGVPFVYYWIDVLHDLIPVAPLRWVGKIFERMTLRRTSRVLTINRALQDYVRGMAVHVKKGVVRGPHLTVVTAAVDKSRFNPDVSGAEVRQRYGIKETDTVLFFMGWLYNSSGLAEVLSSMDGYNITHGIKVLIVGDGDQEARLDKICREKGLNDGSVILTGRIPYEDIPQHIAAADYCILPARPSERIMQHIVPIKVYEYMAMGKPVIATRLPGVWAEFGDGRGIIYVNKPECVVETAVNHQRVPRQRWILERHVLRNVGDWSVIVDQFERILQKEAKLNA